MTILFISVKNMVSRQPDVFNSPITKKSGATPKVVPRLTTSDVVAAVILLVRGYLKKAGVKRKRATKL